MHGVADAGDARMARRVAFEQGKERVGSPVQRQARARGPDASMPA